MANDDNLHVLTAEDVQRILATERKRRIKHVALWALGLCPLVGIAIGVARAGEGAATVALCVAVGVALFGVFVFAVCLPGLVASSRRHRNAQAIWVCGIIGVLTFGILWCVALVWAFTDNVEPPRYGYR